MPIQDIAWKISRERWTTVTGGERGPGRSILAEWHDDDDDDIYKYIYIISRYDFYISLRAWTLICNKWFHAVLLPQSSSREWKISEKSKKSKYTFRWMFTLRFVWLVFFFCVCVCVCLFRLNLHITERGRIGDYWCVCVCVYACVCVCVHTWVSRQNWGLSLGYRCGEV